MLCSPVWEYANSPPVPPPFILLCLLLSLSECLLISFLLCIILLLFSVLNRVALPTACLPRTIIYPMSAISFFSFLPPYPAILLYLLSQYPSFPLEQVKIRVLRLDMWADVLDTGQHQLLYITALTLVFTRAVTRGAASRVVLAYSYLWRPF